MHPADRTRKNPAPAYDPDSDVLLFSCREYPPGPGIPEGNRTHLFVHPVQDGALLFYLSYRLHPSDPPQIRPLDVPADAAAFIMGAAGPELRGIPEPDRYRIQGFFPEWFGND